MVDSNEALTKLTERMDRLLALVERAVPAAPVLNDLDAADAFVWQGESGWLQPVPEVNRVAINLLCGIDNARDTLVENTERFASGLPANNALLWGARGMGKSSLVKAVHARIVASGTPLKLIEVHREEIDGLPALLNVLRALPHRCLLFCDDLSFDHDDTSYKALKAALDGGIEGRPDNVLLYATSNRRHLMPRDMIDNERATAITPGEAVEEKVSLSDRFGLWLGFHKCSQDDYLEMIDGYAADAGLQIAKEELHHAALQWATVRGSRSGRVAWQFIVDQAGREGVRLG
ncbi:ATP-binding protein [Rhizobiaceae bacterium]|nr:ATP-binding protein [Rhizobiaceae bacterium]